MDWGLIARLFVNFLQVGLFSFGGGYAAMPIIRQIVVLDQQWLTQETFIDLITISEMTPGPIAVNGATFVGMNLAGLPGAVAATLGVITPSFFIVLALGWFYYRYRRLNVVRRVLDTLQPAIAALIAAAGLRLLIAALWGSAGFGLALSSVNWLNALIFLSALFLLRSRKPSPILVMLGSGLVGIVVYGLGLL